MKQQRYTRRVMFNYHLSLMRKYYRRGELRAVWSEFTWLVYRVILPPIKLKDMQ